MKKLMVIDGSSLLYRAFFALPPLSNAHGIPTNAVYGFLTMFLKIYEQLHPDYVAVAFDKGKVTFRTEMFEGYKAQRPPAPDDLRTQFDLMKDVLQAMGIKTIECEGFEGDDIIGSFSKQVGSKDIEVAIITGDRDTFQLIDEYSSVFFTKKGISEMLHVTRDNMTELYGYPPEQVIEMKALMGDSSDNIPGVPGVGEKTALKLIGEYGSLEAVYAGLDTIKGKLKEKLVNNKEMAFLSKQLATIKTDMDIVWSEEDFSPKLVWDEVQPLFEKLGFNSLVTRLQNVMGEEILPPIEDFSDFVSTDFLIKKSLDESYFVNKEVAIYFTFSGKAPFLHMKEAFLYNGEQFAYFGEGDLQETELTAYLQQSAKIITADSKSLIEALGEDSPVSLWNDEEQPATDLTLIAYLLEPTRSSYDLPFLNERFAGNINFQKTEKELGASVVQGLFTMAKSAEAELTRLHLDELYAKIELPLVHTLAVMEKNGIYVDKTALEKMQTAFREEEVQYKKKIFELAGHEFNINSPKQLGVVLFEELGLPIIKKTKTGYSTDAEVLDFLRQDHAIVEQILAYRTVTKLISTYLDGLVVLINERTKRIHTSFNQFVTATGRLSSSEPNLQNIPVRTEKGRQIRSLFLPGEGYEYLLSADYSQIELRVLAHFSKDPGMLQAFADGLDIHRYTAAEVLHKNLAEVTSEERSHAKAVNFGIIYGISDFGLSRDLGISREEAKKYIQNYFARYEKIHSFMDGLIEKAREEGVAHTMFGRVRELPEIKSKNFHRRSFAERTAMNTPIQGTAADIIKLAMNAVERRLCQENLQSRLLLQVHDELVLEVTESELEQVTTIVREEMENVVTLEVPLLVDIHHGKNWAEVK